VRSSLLDRCWIGELIPNSKRNKGKGRNKHLPKTPQTLGGPNKEKTTKEVPIAKKKRSTKGVFLIFFATKLLLITSLIT